MEQVLTWQLSAPTFPVPVCLHPPFAYHSHITDAVDAGAHVFTENAIASTLKQAQNIVERVSRYPTVKTQLGFMLRFSRVVEVINDFAFRRGHPILFMGRFFSSDPYTHWWRYIEKNGREPLEQVVHLVDIACHLFGEPERVRLDLANLCRQVGKNHTAEDMNALMIQFENSGLAAIGATNQAVPGGGALYFRVVFENLTVSYLGPGRGDFWVTESGENEFFQIDEKIDPYLRETEDFLPLFPTTTRLVSHWPRVCRRWRLLELPHTLKD